MFEGIRSVLSATSEVLPAQHAALRTQREILALLQERDALNPAGPARAELDARIVGLNEQLRAENEAIHGRYKELARHVPWFRT